MNQEKTENESDNGPPPYTSLCQGRMLLEYASSIINFAGTGLEPFFMSSIRKKYKNLPQKVFIILKEPEFKVHVNERKNPFELRRLIQDSILHMHDIMKISPRIRRAPEWDPAILNLVDSVHVTTVKSFFGTKTEKIPPCIDSYNNEELHYLFSRVKWLHLRVLYWRGICGAVDMSDASGLNDFRFMIEELERRYQRNYKMEYKEDFHMAWKLIERVQRAIDETIRKKAGREVDTDV